MTSNERVGVVVPGPALAPGLVLKRDGNRVEVLIEKDGGGTEVYRTIAEYAKPVIMDSTREAWEDHWQRLEAAAPE